MEEGNDPMETCPYDSSHLVMRSRMPFHLIRCAKNHPDKKKKTCPYDARHLLDPKDFRNHLKTCDRREIAERYRQSSQELEPSFQDYTLPIEINAVEVDMADFHSWDEAPSEVSCNPLQNIKSKDVVRTLIGYSKTVTRQFRMNQRLHFSRLDDENKRSARAETLTVPKYVNSATKVSERNVKNLIADWSPQPTISSTSMKPIPAVDDLRIDRVIISNEPKTPASSGNATSTASESKVTKAKNSKQKTWNKENIKITPLNNCTLSDLRMTNLTINEQETSTKQNSRVLSAKKPLAPVASEPILIPKPNVDKQVSPSEEEWQVYGGKRSSLRSKKSKQANKKRLTNGHK